MNKFVTNECRAAFTERSTRSCTLFGNNTGARSLNFLYFGTDFSSRAIYLVFADLAFSGVKSLSRKIFFFLDRLLRLLACLLFSGACFHERALLFLLSERASEWERKRGKKSIRCYTVCTHNRIRSPRLAAFGRIEARWVREFGKIGPYLRYKDWLRRRLLVQLFFAFFRVRRFFRKACVRIEARLSCFPQYFLWELARTRGIRLFN